MFLDLYENQQTAERPAEIVDNPALLNLSRRHILAGGGLLLGTMILPACSPKDGSAVNDGASSEPAMQTLFVGVAPDGSATLTISRSEMGQQVLTSVAQLIADELEIPWDRFSIVQGDGDVKYGDQNTDGSTSIRNHMTRFRQAGAAARMMLEQAAATLWEVSASDCYGEQGVVYGPGRKKIGYGDLAGPAADLTPPEGDAITLKPREKWRYIGKSKPSLTVPKIVKGEGEFGIDIRLENMVHAVIARPPQVFGTVASFDDTAALSVPGVIKTIK